MRPSFMVIFLPLTLSYNVFPDVEEPVKDTTVLLLLPIIVNSSVPVLTPPYKLYVVEPKVPDTVTKPDIIVETDNGSAKNSLLI